MQQTTAKTLRFEEGKTRFEDEKLRDNEALMQQPTDFARVAQTWAEQTAAQAQPAATTQRAGHAQAAAQALAGAAYKEASPIPASNIFSFPTPTSYLSRAHLSSPPAPYALQHTQLTPPGYGGGRGGQLMTPPQAVTTPEVGVSTA